ncbi:hypothetical protein D3C81_1825080 [compost metagenome]
MQQHVEHHRAAVALQLEHVLTGERVGAAEEQQQALVDHLAIVGEERAVVGVARLGLAAAEADGDGPRARTGNADDADPAATLRGGDGGDGVTDGLHGGLRKADSKTPHEGASAFSG